MSGVNKNGDAAVALAKDPLGNATINVIKCHKYCVIYYGMLL
jgi:hypothetical protein